MESPGYAAWEPEPGTRVGIEYRFGRLTMRRQGDRKIEKMRQIARALGARLFGPDGRDLSIG